MKKKTFILTKFQRQVVIGTLLGDAHAETLTKGTTFRLKFEQSNFHKPYLFHLFEVFNSCCRAQPYQKLNGSWAFSTRFSVSFRFYGRYFYDNKGCKRIPRNIGRFLTPVSLAYWFMDDGSLKSKQSKGMILNTHCFKKQEIDLLLNALKLKFSIECKLRKQKDGYQIYISGHSFELFVSIIKPYIHDSMWYKIPKPRIKKD